MKTSSADGQVRAPGWFQLMGIQNRTKEEIHTLEIFPRAPMEEVLQSQPETGMGRKTIRYQDTWKLVKGVGFIQRWFFLLFKNEDSEKRLQEKLKICPFSGQREEEIAYIEKLEEELRENIIEQIHPEQAKWFSPTFINPKPHQKWRKILDASALNKEMQTILFKMKGTDEVRDLTRKGDWATTLPNLLRTITSNGSNEDTERVRHKNSELCRRSDPPTLEQTKIVKINIDNNENFGSIWIDNNLGKMRNRTKTTDQLPSVDLRLGKDVHKDDRPKKTRTTLLIKEIYQPNIETNPDQDKISSINNRQAEFFKCPNKRSFSLLKTNGLNKNKSIEEQGIEREYDSTQGNPSRALLVVVSDIEEQRDDSRSENTRGSNGIRRIPERLENDPGIINRRQFSPTWRMEQGTQEMGKQQEGDGNHILRTIPLRISLQRAANLSDQHQVRQLYRSIKFSKTKSRGNSNS
ncbi:MAG: hypothetical protein EZS28_001077 [Streblomastix strix]|uniref:Uncharacterized protein n=1 Tax=Streblomastix strix TaxID=222440 RepID=A0A5J4XA29_9EUKA|nr:MAG: hypothetical protein EZS28_001077 [Streblomastix strix]